MMIELAVVACLLASIPAVNVAWNLWLYRAAPTSSMALSARGIKPLVSVLIPARDEEKNIENAVRSATGNRGVDLEVIVMDDDSSDRTAEIVREIGKRDPRVRLVKAPTLPQGWCGKQHACARLAAQADAEYLLFVDADVELAPDALSRMVTLLRSSGRDLISGVPRQKTDTVLGRMVIPLIHFILLGFLPLAGMRRWQSASWAAGCGQLFMVRREAYEQAGGHGSIRSSRHDGLMLPRSFRQAGYETDLFDATDVAACRMYDNDSDLLQGFTKNATEGMASPGAILPWTLLLLGGQVLPFLLLPLSSLAGDSTAASLALLAVGLVMGSRLALSVRFKQSIQGALLHPVGILVVLAIQWFALLRSFGGGTVAWKGRT
jgi:cellulose synthase/poly-beta-1,6-N-acetylglucosamine synthase-like glycosyltransferase